MAAKVRGLQQWCRRQCEGYRDVSITNMTSSWKSGLAFCAIIHRYRPDLISYDALSKEDVFGNNKLAFDVASEHLGIPALLDPEDMLAMKVPDKLCIITYVAQYYNYFHDKTPVLKSEASTKQSSTADNQQTPERPTVLGVNGSAKRDANMSTGPLFLSPTEDDFLRDMTANAAHRRGSIVDDTCYRCGQRVYLLERHLSATGQLFHRHCYRDSERTATLQRRRPSCQKENLLPPSEPLVASTGRRKSSTSGTKNVELAISTTSPKRSAEHKCEHLKNAERPLENPKTVTVAGTSGTTQKNALTAVAGPKPLLAARTSTDAPKTTNTETCGAILKLLGPNRNQSTVISPRTDSSSASFTVTDRNTKVTSPVHVGSQCSEGKTFTGSGISGSVSTTDQRGSSGTSCETTVAPSNPPDRRRETSIPTLANPARPAISTVKQVESTAAGTKTPRIVAVGRTTNVSPPSPASVASSSERSSGVVTVSEPAPLIIVPQTNRSGTDVTSSDQRQSHGSAAMTKENSLLMSSSNPIRSSTSIEHSPENRHLPEVSLSPLSSCSSESSGSSVLSPVSKTARTKAKANVSDQGRVSIGHKTPSASSQHVRSTAEHISSSSKTRYLYGPGSQKSDQTFEDVHGSTAEASLVNNRNSAAELSGSPTRTSYSGRRQVAHGRTDRPKSSYEILSAASSLSAVRENRKASDETAEKSRNEPMVKGILENLTKATQRKLHDSSSKETAARMTPDEVVLVPGRPTITLKSGRQTQSPTNKPATDSAISQPSASFSSSASLELGINSITIQNENLSPTSPGEQLRRRSPAAHSEADEFFGNKKYLTKWQAELQRRRETRLGLQQRSDGRGSEYQQLLPAALSNVTTHRTIADTDQLSSAATTRPLSTIYSKSVDDLRDITRQSAAEVGKVEDRKTEWQLEVERRQANRGGGYVDPEKQPRFHNTRYRMKTGICTNVRQSMYELSDQFTSETTDRDVEMAGEHSASSVSQNRKKSTLSASVDNLSTCHFTDHHSASSVGSGPASSGRSEGYQQAGGGPRTLSTDRTSSSRRSIVVMRIPMSAEPDSPTENYYETIKDNDDLDPEYCSLDLSPTRLRSVGDDEAVDRDILSPKPNRNTPGLQVEDTFQDDEVFRRLDELDAALRELELDGRLLEERIRSETDEAMDDKTDCMMVEWFKLVRKRNELIREESTLIYRQRQQELEGLHNELQFQLQSLMRKPDEMKSRADWQLETSLLRELVDTVTQRSSIVESMETDRLRYQEEDKELEEMMAASGVLEHKRNSSSNWSRRNSIRKKKTHSDKDVNHAGNLTKLKKKKFSIFSLARKSLAPKKGIIREVENVPVTAN